MDVLSHLWMAYKAFGWPVGSAPYVIMRRVTRIEQQNPVNLLPNTSAQYDTDTTERRISIAPRYI